MDHRTTVDHLEREVHAFADAVQGADLATPVPTCGAWDLAKLIDHMGLIHRWAGAMVRDRVSERLDPRTLDLGRPDDSSKLPAWLRAGGESLVATLRAVDDPDAAMYAWGADQHVRFWSRRQLHETLIHHADAQLALGAAVRFDPAVAHDTVDELLDNLPFAQRFSPNVSNLKGDAKSIHVHATDAEGEWMIVLEPSGFSYTHGHGKGEVALRGPITEIALAMYGRVPIDGRFEVFGDRALLDHWVRNSALG